MIKAGKYLNEEEKNNKKIELLTKEFQKKVLETTRLVGEQLYERYNFQKTALAKQFPFMRSNNLWKGLGVKDGNEEVGEAINSGSLSLGFVGGLLDTSPSPRARTRTRMPSPAQQQKQRDAVHDVTTVYT